MRAGKSIFDLASACYANSRVALTQHFRCVPSLIAFSNERFYHSTLQPRRWPTVGRFQPWAAASEQAEGSGWTKGNTEKEEGNNTTTLR